MKKFLLPEQGNFYKANLHCHSTCSDGQKTPEELKEFYKKRGYSIIAYTDHNVFLSHNDLTDEGFVALNGFEMDITEAKPDFDDAKSCHICFISPDPNYLIHPCWHRTKYLVCNAVLHRDEVKFDESEPDFIRSYSPECINLAIKKGRDKGFFVTYNHPVWSQEFYEDYIQHEGMNAMEMFNASSSSIGYEEYNPSVYDAFLMAGKSLFCIGTDDNHNKVPDDSPYCDSFGAFTVVKALRLDYKTVFNALQNGDFYASEGPLIDSLWFEDGKIHITCSPADMITCSYGTRRTKNCLADIGKTVTEAFFEIEEKDKFFRITVTDQQGLRACTNAYFTDRLFDTK